MVIKRLFFKLLFVVGLFVFFNAFAKESQEFTATYLSNKRDTGNFALNLTNNNGDVLSIGYDSYLNGLVRICLELKSDREIQINAIKLNKDNVYLEGNRSIVNGSMNISSRNRIWSDGVKLDFRMCKFKWKKLIALAKHRDFKFCVDGIEVESKLEKRYEFRVSAANLGKLIELVEQAYSLKLLT
ncbi:hypothetical protein [Borrelia parkeri]|uniref:hypothetical protein n=1 Tax=Borrelia parkeri TaxID=141 RepID=UPI0003DEDFDE|nr:hypothetical protein [Borrelia parkeri]AHF45626.1 hypothetical protein X966_p0385 [Borrelia parkeri HR1]